MKIRNGFVSNSSSSCFICGGPGEDNFSVESATEILQKMLDFYNDMEGRNDSFESTFEVPRYATEEDIDLLAGWDVRRENIEGRLLIFSADDNSIAYELFDIISSKFGAYRQHLG